MVAYSVVGWTLEKPIPTQYAATSQLTPYTRFGGFSRAPSPQQMALLAEALGPAAPPFQLISTMPQLAQWVRTFFAVVP
jgi:hypothetical protein